MTAIQKEHVPMLTGLLSVVSLAVVFGAAGGVIPQSAVPTPPERVLETIPHVNAVLSLTAIATIGLGWWWIRRGNVDRHRQAMVLSFALFGTFLVLYLYRLVSLGGPASFPGPAAVEQFVYLPVLAIHILLAVICIPLVYYALLLAATHTVGELARTRHAAVGRIAATLWLVSFALGVVVYAMLYHVY
ncbi:DUF420 domain-containing protein [Halobacteria archaeon AArc-m2/3/4]|uniref:DUF420 domain-containing protein n=1 Tax=Natronoglomus mannanivorans TaxID=2979990 RepID=A0ABT2QDS5_9EURY|nr:DUF420 domain-containing protein [Halobacteria archaeon AArc-m2/3/4]